jgi:hypothetical protein
MLFDFSYKLNPEEKIIGLIRKHWFLLILPLAEVLIIILLLIVFVNKVLFFRQSALISLALGLVCAAYFIYKWILWRADFYVITSQRIIKIAQSGILDRVLGEISLKDIREASLETRGLSATILKFGTIIITLRGGRVFKMENVSNPGLVYQAVIKLKEI